MPRNRRDRPVSFSQDLSVDVFLPCEHEQKGSFQMVKRSDAAILEGARLHVAQPHGWGISMSKSGEFQMSVNTSVIWSGRLALDRHGGWPMRGRVPTQWHV
jgi:hypothetical protein